MNRNSNLVFGLNEANTKSARRPSFDEVETPEPQVLRRRHRCRPLPLKTSHADSLDLPGRRAWISRPATATPHHDGPADVED